MTIHAQPRQRPVPASLDDLPPLAHLPAIRLAAVLWGGLALVDLCRVAGAPSYAGLVALALLVTASSVGMTARTALLAGGVAFLLADGFVVHRDGALAYDGPADLLRLGLLVGTGVLATRIHR